MIDERLRQAGTIVRDEVAQWSLPDEPLRLSILQLAPSPNKVSRRLLALTAGVGVILVAFAAFLIARPLSTGPWVDGVDRPVIESPSTSMTTAGSGIPELQWRQIETPPAVDVIVDLWALSDGGVALRSYDEIWTSDDGTNWTKDASITFGISTGREVIEFAGRWLGIDNTDLGPSVASSVGGDRWVTVPLPAPPDPVEDLLTWETIADQVAANQDGVVIVGRIIRVPDIDAFVDSLATEMLGVEFTVEVDWTRRLVEVSDSTGQQIRSIPFEDLDPQLIDTAPPGSTVVWYSPDGSQWSHVHTVEDRLSIDLAASADGFALLATSAIGPDMQSWISSDGISWVLASSSEKSDPIDLAFFNGQLFAAQYSSIGRMGTSGTWESISNAADLPVIGGGPFAKLETGPYGLVAPVYNSSRADTPVETLWFSPDGRRWYPQDLEDIFGSKGTVKVAVGQDQVVVAHDPTGSAYTEVNAPFEIWIGTLDN